MVFAPLPATTRNNTRNTSLEMVQSMCAHLGYAKLYIVGECIVSYFFLPCAVGI